ncbi:MAG TPA: flotillin-like protein FloA [Planctomycetota bacterium]|nr:flotillin-like protein FloA [Planctomycetota bacterium]
MTNLTMLGIAVVAVVGFVIMILLIKYGWLWIQAMSSKAPVGFSSLVGMSLRHIPPRLIVENRIAAVKAGIQLSTDDLEGLYLAGGHVTNVVRALIAANKANIPLDFKRATAIDLAGRDVVDAVRTSVHPKVIDCPDPAKGRATIDAVAKDGVQLKAKARVTVRTCLDRLIGGATEETIIARVGEGIVTTIGSAGSHKEVLENPDRISRTVMQKGLDSGSAFELLSVDIADVDVGENIGATLQIAQAEADKQIAQAQAEKRRALAVANEQEMSAEVRKNRALVVLAESEVPKAFASALREGKLGVMDYYRLQNIQADTRMRDGIVGGQGKKED